LKAASFSDDFNSADPGWQVMPNTPASFADGQFVLKPNINKGWQTLYPSLFFKSATICTTIKSPPRVTDMEGNENGGLVFWATNRNNYYTADVYPNGRVGVFRMVADQWARVVPPFKSDAVKSGLNAVNEVMVSFSGNMGTVYVNGKKAAEFRGQPPRNGGSIGMFAASETAHENEWHFSDIVVVENE
jgi:hypothetical protein